MNVAETSKWAVIDTAFTKTVAGGNWFENYKSNLPDVSQVQTKDHPQILYLNLLMVEKSNP